MNRNMRPGDSLSQSLSPVQDLDASQSAFCAIQGSSVRLLAPAGSGKTHSLLHRCLTLAERSDRAKPRFLVFTFTRAARDELLDRVKRNPMFQNLAPLTTISTLNAWGFRFLKNIATNPRLVISTKDQYFCAQNVLQPVWRKYPAIAALMADKKRSNKGSRDLWILIDALKSLGFQHDKLASQEDFVGHLAYLIHCGMENQIIGLFKPANDMEILPPGDNPFQQFFDGFIPFWRDACNALRESAFFTLDDQKYWARIEIEEQLREGRSSTGGGRYHHIFVDEFQDINPLDLGLLKAIAGFNKADLTIVGDDDQAIYEWRGATPSFILEPQKHLGGQYETCILTTNYRSPRNIVELSQKLIAHNQRRIDKQVQAARKDAAHVEIRRFSSISQAIGDTVELVRTLLAGDRPNKVALISRKRSQIIPYQIVFAGQNIPFYAAEDLHVLLSEAFKEMKDLLAIRGRESAGGMFDSDPVQDLLRLCDKIKRYPLAKNDRETLRRHLLRARPDSLRAAATALSSYDGPLKGSNSDGRMSSAFSAAIMEFLNAETVSETIHALSCNFEGLQKDYGKALDDIFYTDPPFLYLAEFSERYGGDYAAFYRDIDKAMATLARVSSDEDEHLEEEPEWKRPLHLMTALRAKGKEFDAVIVLDANNGIWPSKLATSENDLEQERRLFYVAMTRARRYLYFIVNDSIIGEKCSPSPYLAEMGLSIPATMHLR